MSAFRVVVRAGTGPTIMTHGYSCSCDPAMTWMSPPLSTIFGRGFRPTCFPAITTSSTSCRSTQAGGCRKRHYDSFRFGLALAVVDENLGAAFGKGNGRGATDAARGTCDESGLS